MKSQAVTIIEHCTNFMAFTAKHNICFVIHLNDFSSFLVKNPTMLSSTIGPIFRESYS